MNYDRQNFINGIIASMTSGERVNPYQDIPDRMRAALSDPKVNRDEHVLFFPRLKLLLPSRSRFSRHPVSRVLDYGCGPGNFTEELAKMYPRATVLGADAAKGMLPTESARPNLSFREWNGMESLGERPFDLIVAKMVLHYLSPAELGQVMTNLVSLLAPRGSLVISVPHSNDSQQFVSRPIDNDRFTTEAIERPIGQTGIVGEMWHRNHWLSSTFFATPDDYTVITDDVRNSQGELKRQNILLCPKGEQVVTTFKKLKRRGIIKDPPRFAAEVVTSISTDLRSILKATNFKP